MLYFAPMNLVGNACYRHLLLRQGADFVVSELIRIDRIEEEFAKEKQEIIPGDEDRTIIQIGAATEDEIDRGLRLFPDAQEINLNMCCPHSTLVQDNRCGGILKQPALMRRICMHLARSRGNASVKIRLGQVAFPAGALPLNLR